MPRQARLEMEGGLYHVLNRGLERRALFHDTEDYQQFKDILAEFVQEEHLHCYAWVLMPNHFHLVLERGKGSLSRFMSRLSTSYAGYFNRKHHRAGRLYQNRYKSILCDKDDYFKVLVAYIHLNPLRAGLVKTFEDLARYRWSGHRAIMGEENQPWMDVDRALEQFGSAVGSARRNYLEYLREQRGIRRDLSGGGLIKSGGGLSVVMGRGKDEREEYDTRVLGSGVFVKSVLEKCGKIADEQPSIRKRWEKVTVEGLVRAVADACGIQKERIIRKGKSTRDEMKARSLITYLAVTHMGEKRIDIAERFRITPGAMTRLYGFGKKIIDEDDGLARKILTSLI